MLSRFSRNKKFSPYRFGETDKFTEVIILLLVFLARISLRFDNYYQYQNISFYKRN
jgi:hypothetical protein